MKKYKFKARYTAEATLTVELNNAQQSELPNSDNTLINTWIDENGFSEFINAIKHEDYEVLSYESLVDVVDNNTLFSLDMCVFTYNLSNDDTLYSDMIYGNNSDELHIKDFIIQLQNSRKRGRLDLTHNEIFNLTINR